MSKSASGPRQSRCWQHQVGSENWPKGYELTLWFSPDASTEAAEWCKRQGVDGMLFVDRERNTVNVCENMNARKAKLKSLQQEVM